jgi:sugar lactone lactonase YvrE
MFRGALVAVAVTACTANTCTPNTPIRQDAAIDAAPDAFVPCQKGALTLTVTTLAGCEQVGAVDGSRDEARFDNPTNVVIGPNGVVYVADFDNSRIRRVEPDGTTTTLVERPDFQLPFGLALGPDGTLYVETDDNDRGEHSIDTGTIWRVDPATGDASVVARDLGRPRGLAVLPDGRLAMADHMHHVVSILDPATGVETTLAGVEDAAGHANGIGAEARFAQPYDLVVLADGSLAVTDQDNHRIRRVTLAGEVSDLAGSGEPGNLDGPAAVATFHAPQGLARVGDALFVTDVKRYFIRRLAAGQVSTIAGDGTQGWIDADSPRAARFYGIEGIDAEPGRLVIADGNGGDGNTFHRIRVVDLGRL